jgi:radical SAM superfamily enzyme YgiQ (UPF0313 family)
MEWERSAVDSYERSVEVDSALDGSTDWAEAKRLKVCLACSHGGHLTEMLQLQEAFEGHDTFYFCYDAATTQDLEFAYRVPNMARNPVEFLKNLFRIRRIFKKEQPDLVVSTGAEIAIPVLIIAKLLGVPMLYIECGAQVTRPSITGRIMCRFADQFYVQWPELVDAYGPRAMMRGSLIDEDLPVASDRSHEKLFKVTVVQPAQVGAFASDQPPMGLAYIASILQQHGCEVRVIDANVEKLGPDEVTRIIAQQQPDLVCFTVTTPLLPSALQIVHHLRRMPKVPLLLAGGPHATVLPGEMLEADMFDFVVRSEGEEVMADLIEQLIAGDDAEGVPGVSWRRNGEIIHNPNRELTPTLEHYPYPDWSLFPMKRYSSLARRKDFSVPITTSRGCPYGCTFCYKGVYGRKLRNRSPENVVDEWQYLIERYGAQEIAVLDDVFTLRADRAIAICDLLAERGLDRVPWSTVNGIRADNASPELMYALKRGGCYRVYFGIESGVQDVVDKLDKRLDLDKVRDGVKNAKEAGLEVGGYFMIGNLGETYEDMDATIDFALELDPDLAQFTIATPYPGTKMYEQVVSGGEMLISSWEQLASYGTSIFRMEHLEPESVGAKYRKAIRRFYLRPTFIRRQLREMCTWTGFRHRVLGAWLLVQLSLLGGRKRVTVKGTFK